MPKPPPPPQQGLDEVERALSVLGGRHPEHERIRRETHAAAQERGRALAKELSARARRRVARALGGVALALAVGAAGLVVYRLAVRTSAIRAALRRDEAPFVAAGLQEIASNEIKALLQLEADVPEGSCAVALATSGTLRVTFGGASYDGGRTIGFCTCGSGKARLEAQGVTEDPVGVALLRIDARTVGGPLARPWSPFHPQVWGEGGAECAEGMLDAWLGRQPPTPASDAPAGPATNALEGMGFRAVATLPQGVPFAIVDAAADACHLAVGDGDLLALRTAGGTRPIAHARGALAWCASAAARVSVWREGETGGAVTVFSAPGKRLGGLLGVREGAGEAGLALATRAVWQPPDDLAWEARMLLAASALEEASSGPIPGEATAPDGRLATVVSTVPLAWEPAGNVAGCDPARADGEKTEALCALVAPASLWRKGEGAAFAARAEVPVWASSLAARREPDAVARLPELLGLARRLARSGFVPTLFEGATELESGVRVVGRAGEDAVVAVGLAPAPPWVHPYSDGVPWDLGDAPRVVSLAPGAAVVLHASPAPSVPAARRRTVVFRHAVR